MTTQLDCLVSFYDGLGDEAWETVKPFNFANRDPRAGAAAQPLAAPLTPLSTQFRLNMGTLGILDIKPP